MMRTLRQGRPRPEILRTASERSGGPAPAPSPPRFPLAADLQSALDRAPHALTGRIRQPAQRPATPWPKLAQEVGSLAARVDSPPARRGFLS
jgi:hypothetical protein